MRTASLSPDSQDPLARWIASRSKSYWVALAMALLLGPAGAFYASAVGGLVLCVAAGATGAIGGTMALAWWPVSVVFALLLVARHNQLVHIDARLLLALAGR